MTNDPWSIQPIARSEIAPETRDRKSQIEFSRPLAGAGRTSIQISSLLPHKRALRGIRPSLLLKKSRKELNSNVTIGGVKIDATHEDIQRSIKNEGLSGSSASYGHPTKYPAIRLCSPGTFDGRPTSGDSYGHRVRV
jgi:hypothetical protein